MNPWMPVSGCTVACAADPVPTVGWGDRARRRTRMVAEVAAVGTRPIPETAAALLGALGVAVEVVPPSVPWPVRPGGPGVLVVANHVSWIDDVALLALLPDARPVAKAEIAGWPVVGPAALRSGAIFVDRARLRRLPAAVAAATDLLRSGAPVLVHPEGTTACGAELGRFRPAFFQAAVDAGASVCPVALRYRLDDGTGTAVASYLSEDSLRDVLRRVVAARGLVLEVHLLPPLAPGTDRREMAALAEYAVAAVTEDEPPRVGAHPVPARPRGATYPAGALRDTPVAYPRPAGPAGVPR